MTTINPYLNFSGNAEDAFNFYKSVFGGEFAALMRYSTTPSELGSVPDDAKNQIMHVSLPIGNGSMLMGSDTPQSMGFKLSTGNSVQISLHPDSEQETDRLFNGLSAGGKVTVPLNKTFWNAYFGMFVDKYGVSWIVNCDLNKN